MENLGIKFQSQYKFKKSEIKWARFDFAIKGMLIEYHGQQHYIPCSFGSKKRNADILFLIDSLRRDKKKEQWCEKYNIPLIVIPYWDFDRIPEIIDTAISGKKINLSTPPDLFVKYKPIREKILARLRSKGVIC